MTRGGGGGGGGGVGGLGPVRATKKTVFFLWLPSRNDLMPLKLEGDTFSVMKIVGPSVSEDCYIDVLFSLCLRPKIPWSDGV